MEICLLHPAGEYLKGRPAQERVRPNLDGGWGGGGRRGGAGGYGEVGRGAMTLDETMKHIRYMLLVKHTLYIINI